MAAVPALDAQGYTPLRAYRYERKFLVDEMLPCQVEGIIKLHPHMFTSPYPPRFVNNLYFDTPDMENYYDNLNGAQRRRKFRVRWYGPLEGEIERPMLEIKVKDGLVGTKHTYPLAPFCLDENFCDRHFRLAAGSSSLPQRVWEDLCGLNMVLLNRYHRRYYATHDGRFRVTLDSQLAFYKVNGGAKNVLMHRQENWRDVVVELKYDVKQEPLASRVASGFPFRVTRNSKYVQGVERVYF